MAIIDVHELRKAFVVSERGAGFWGAIRGLVQRKGRVVEALAGASFSVRRGELVGYIGPNGAGKSTTVKILSGILVPDGGRCEVLGLVPWKDRIAHVARIGVVFGQRSQLWWDLPVAESFDLLRDVYRVPRERYEARLDELVTLLDLSRLLATPARQLSLGQRMRCDLVASLLHGPELLFLDEPSIGLDAVSKLAVRDFIRRLNKDEGLTCLLTSHDMDDVEALCSRVLVIARGRILADTTLDGLRERVSSERRLIVDLEGEGEAVTDPDATLLRREGHRVHLAFDPRKVSTAALIARVTGRHAIRDLYVENPPIEEIIARLYEELAS